MAGLLVPPSTILGVLLTLRSSQALSDRLGGKLSYDILDRVLGPDGIDGLHQHCANLVPWVLGISIRTPFALRSQCQIVRIIAVCGSITHLFHKLSLWVCLAHALWLSHVFVWVLYVLSGFNAGVTNHSQETRSIRSWNNAQVCSLNFTVTYVFIVGQMVRYNTYISSYHTVHAGYKG